MIYEKNILIKLYKTVKKNAIQNKPVHERSNLDQSGFFAHQKTIGICDIENVHFCQPYYARPLPIMKAKRIIP